MNHGFATPEGTARFSARRSGPGRFGFYRQFDNLQVSSLGLGTYLGNPDDPTDIAYRNAVIAAVRGGINFLDTAVNYRHQRSERSIGAALVQLLAAGDAQRDEIVVATKAGFLTTGALPGFLKPEDIAGGMHSMQPDFLADQIDRSRANLGLDTIDIFYLHNPETQLGSVSREEFERRIRLAFAKLETLVTNGKIRKYGAATWEGFRAPAAKPALDLARLVEIATEVGGTQHHFRLVQLPFNLAMLEALSANTQHLDGKAVPLLHVARTQGLMVYSSASLLQGQLSAGLPARVQQWFPGCENDAQRAIQFVRSTPGITCALVGMARREHVEENLRTARVSPLTREEFRALLTK